MKKFSTFTNCQRNTNQNYLIPMRMATVFFFLSKITEGGKYREKLESLYAVGGIVKWCAPMESNMAVP